MSGIGALKYVIYREFNFSYLDIVMAIAVIVVLL